MSTDLLVFLIPPREFGFVCPLPPNANKAQCDCQAADRALECSVNRPTAYFFLMSNESMIIPQRGLCCFPNLAGKKPNTSSDAFLQVSAAGFSLKYSVSSSPPPWFQKLRDRQEQMELPSKSDDIIMLERQGRSSQKSRPSSGNLMQVTKLAVGQTDIRNIGQNVSTAANGSSLRGSSLPPPRNLKPPRKNFGFSGSLNRKDEVVGGRPVDGHNSPRRDQQPTFLQQLTGATYQRLSPTKKRSLLPTPARGNRPMAAHQYMPIGRSPSPAPHAHFILGRTPTPTPQQQQQQKCTGSRNF